MHTGMSKPKKHKYYLLLWTVMHAEELKAKKREYYLKHREEIIARTKAYKKRKREEQANEERH